jgi:hypothetical protein
MSYKSRAQKNAYARAYYWKNREADLERNRRYRAAHLDELKEKSNARQRQERIEFPDEVRARDRERYHAQGRNRNSAEQRLTLYGLTQRDYERLLSYQDHRCPVCGIELVAGSGGKTSPHIDHEHGGDVRGILCGRCNPGIGYFLDSPAALRSAANYLENPPAREALTPKPRIIQLHILDETA